MENQQEVAEDNKMLWLAASFVAGIIFTVLALEYYGYIKHSTKADAAVVEEFKLVDLNMDSEMRISPRDSGKIAFCVDGYILMRPDNEKKVAAVLVDSKMRGVRCEVN